MSKNYTPAFEAKIRKSLKAENADKLLGFLESADPKLAFTVGLLDKKILDPKKAFLLELFFGFLGVGSMCLGNKGLAVIKLLTLGGCGVLWMLGIFTAVSAAKRKNWKMFVKTYPNLK